MKPYLNKQEKNHVLTIASFIAFFEELAEKWDEMKRDTDPIGDMRRARTRAQRVLNYIFKDIDPEQAGAIKRQIDKMEVVVKYKNQAAHEYKKMQELEEVTPVITEDLYDIVNLTLDFCINTCNREGKEVEGCTCRKLLLKYDIPALNENPKAGKCLFQLNKPPEDKDDWEPKEG